VPKTSDLQEAVNLAVGTLLPEVLRKILPDMLPHLVAMSSPSLSPSQSNRILTQNRLPSLGALINARATAHVESQLQKIYDDTLEHATGLRNAADLEFQDVLDEYKLTAEVEFQEVVDEQKLDLTMAKDEVTTELARTIDDKLYEFKESAAEIVENLGEQAEMVYLEVREKLDGLVGKERACLKLERETTERDRRAFERERGRATERNATRNRGRRTVSLP
jgi:F0F1-type ATP synthase membrane subunit b/b'